MRRTMSTFTAPCLGLALLGLVACGPSQEEQAATAQADQLVQLEEAKSALDAKRQGLADLEAQLDALDEAEEGVADRQAELEGEIVRLTGEIEADSEDLASVVVDFINSDPPIEGEPLTASQLAGIRIKSAEDMVVANEHIQKGGDYRRAMDIYNQALLVDPDNPDLQAALAQAEELRWMTQERFSEVKKGMNTDEVRDLLGQPNLRNVRDYPDRGVTAWFYPTADDGAAAAVWFRAGKDEVEVVYQTKFEAIEGKSTEEAEAG
jgi:tetratricopeptide (TPR) repeat protein